MCQHLPGHTGWGGGEGPGASYTNKFYTCILCLWRQLECKVTFSSVSSPSVGSILAALRSYYVFDLCHKNIGGQATEMSQKFPYTGLNRTFLV